MNFPLLIKAGASFSVIGGVAIPFVTESITLGGSWKVADLFSYFGCANLTKGKTTAEKENIYLCHFSSTSSERNDYPKLKMFYHSGSDNPRKIVKVEFAPPNNNSQQEFRITLDNNTVITKGADSNLMKNWIKYENGRNAEKELIPEEQCVIVAGWGTYHNLYNFNCFLKGDRNKRDIWVTQASAFSFSYTPE